MKYPIFYSYKKLVDYFLVNIPDEKAGYCEKHHIIPRSEGTDERTVLLPYSYHILAHFLRYKELLAKNDYKKAGSNLSAVKRMVKFDNWIDKDTTPEEIIKLSENIRKEKTTYVTNGKLTYLLKESDLEEFLKNNKDFWKGRTFNTGNSGTLGTVSVTNGINNKFIKKENLEEFLKNNKDFKVGYKANRDSHPTTLGCVWVNKDGIRKNVKKEELSDYISKGWTKGSNNHTNLGRTSIYKKDQLKMVDKSKLNKFIEEGWTTQMTEEYRARVGLPSLQKHQSKNLSQGGQE